MGTSIESSSESDPAPTCASLPPRSQCKASIYREVMKYIQLLYQPFQLGRIAKLDQRLLKNMGYLYLF
jgi:hypothetical protein